MVRADSDYEAICVKRVVLLTASAVKPAGSGYAGTREYRRVDSGLRLCHSMAMHFFSTGSSFIHAKDMGICTQVVLIVMSFACTDKERERYCLATGLQKFKENLVKAGASGLA